MSNVYILGCGGFAREVSYVFYERSSKHYIPNRIYNHYLVFSGYLSDDKAEHSLQLPFGSVMGAIEDLPDNEDLSGQAISFIPGIGCPKIRKFLVDRALVKKWIPVGVIHNSVFIGDADIGEGSIICSHCSITTNITIGKYVNINLNCTVGHDTVIEDYCNISPGCLISGHVHIGKNCDLGTGVNILPNVTIGDNCIIGAGATVTKDIPANSLAVGTPAKVIKELLKETK